MSEEQLHNQPKQIMLKEAVGSLPEYSRRRLLKGTVAIPVIMTLHSGAALALTSNLVGPTKDIGSAVQDENGNLRCVHPDGGDSGANPVDLGENPYLIDANPDGMSDLDKQALNCQNGGGILVSAAAWNSIGIKVTGLSSL